MKKVVSAFVFIFSAIMFAPLDNHAAASEDAQSVFIDRQEQVFEISPVIENKRILVPFRHIFEQLGATVTFHAREKLVTANKDGVYIEINLESKTAVVAGEEQLLDAPAKVLNGRTLVPLRFVSTALGADVDWDGAAQSVYITTGKTEREAILNTIFKIESSTLKILNKQMESEIFYSRKLPFSHIEKKLTNYYTNEFIAKVWRPFYSSSYFSEWYTHTTYLFDFLLNEPYLTETMQFAYEKEVNKELRISFRDDPRLNEGPMTITPKRHEYVLVNLGNGWKISEIY